MIQSLIGRKIDQTQGFLEDGTRVPLSIISVAGNVVTQIKTADHEGYNSIQLGFGTWKKPTKPMAGHIKKAGIQEKMPRFFREVRVDEVPNQNLGSVVSVQEVFEPGDMVDVSGTSKGKGFAGVVKRHGFHGGPKTHGQSDRHRAPGAIGSGTTPGRVYRGKKMAGRMGNEQVTIKNLEVLDVKDDAILVRGLIPGAKGSIVTITKVGKNKKFKPLWTEQKTKEQSDIETENVGVMEEATAGGSETETQVEAALVESSGEAPVDQAGEPQPKADEPMAQKEENKDAS